MQKECELGFGNNLWWYLLVIGEAFGDMLVLCGSYWLYI